MTATKDYGKRLIPQILDDLALTDPDRIIYSVALSSNASQGMQHISARNFARAIDKTAWWLHNEVGKSESIQTVGYIGPHDLRHILLTCACAKVGYTALFLSPKNSTQGALAVLELSECNVWVQPVEQSRLPQVEEFLQQRPMKVLNIPEIKDLLDAETTVHYAYTKTFDEAAKDPFCVLHTSGSTGLPKPIIWSHALIGTMDAVRLLPPTEGDHGLAPWTSKWREGDRLYSSFPMSHGAGIIMNILIPSLFGTHCILGPAGVIPNMDLIDSLAEYGQIDIWSMVPSLVDELGETPDVLAKFQSAKFICASGGPISPISAAKVNDTVRVLNLTGTTEGLFIGNLEVEREDWLYFAFHPFSGFEFREVEPGVYEHWVHRNEHWPLFQGIFHTFPDQEHINLKDLYVKHPTKPDHWAYKGRSDDIIVLSNGYKISPLDTEALITTHAAIRGCLVIGTGKSQASLLIELKDPSRGDDELFNSIWETVQRANTLSLHKNQLQRDYIMFSEEAKPFVRTDKGTIKRHDTVALYADYIERFYISRSNDADTQLSMTFDTTSLESVTKAVRQIFGSLLPKFEHAPPDADLFDLGLDSLLAFQATRSLRAAMGLKEQLATRHLYANPTISKFSAALVQLAAGAKTADGTNSTHDDRSAKVKELSSKHNSHHGIKMNSFDMIIYRLYLKMLVFIPLRQGVEFESVFARLKLGLARTFKLLPELDTKLAACSEDEPEYKKGQMRLVFPSSEAAGQNGDLNGSHLGPRQLIYKDLSDVIPSFQELQNAGFVSSAFKDDLVLGGAFCPALPADVMIAQASFVEGGCLLAAGFHHSVFDGTGAVTVLRAWAESCRYIEGDESASCSWLDPESMNHNLPPILWEEERYGQPVKDIDPATWDYLGFTAPETFVNGNGTSKVEKSSPHPPLSSVPDAEDRQLSSVTFTISPENLQKLKQDVISDPEVNGAISSTSDIVQAFFWRAMMRARYRAAKEVHGRTFEPSDMSTLELPIDGRPYWSTLLPSTYMGNVLIVNRPSMALDTLCSPKTSIGHVALLLREAAARIRPSMVHDAFTLLQSRNDYTSLKLSFAGLNSVGGLHAMLSNMMLFPTSEVSFGDEFFENKGVPDAARPLMDGYNTSFRLGVILPMRNQGSVELLLGTFPEELGMLLGDHEFTRYAKFLG